MRGGMVLENLPAQTSQPPLRFKESLWEGVPLGKGGAAFQG